MHVLITSAGRRTSLVKAFKDVSNPGGCKVFAGDLDGLAPSLYLADEAVRLPPVTSENYIPFLLDYVTEQGIKLVVPTIDTELQVFAENAERFNSRGCRLLISDPELIRACRDKWNTYTFFDRLGVRTPKSWLPEDLDEAAIAELPHNLFVKPRDGSASVNTYPTDRESLRTIVERVPNAIVQERIDGREITIDAFLDFDGTPIHYVPRIRIKTVGGESVQGVTIAEPGLGEWLEGILEVIGRMGGIGPMCMQAFLTDDGPVLFEINPRFGGGYPLGRAAGGSYPEHLVSLLRGDSVKPRLGDYTVGLSMTRYYCEVFTEEPKW